MAIFALTSPGGITAEGALAFATPLAIIIAAVIQQYNTIRARKERVEVKVQLDKATHIQANKIEEVKQGVKEVHALANSAMTAQLKIAANALRRLADRTGEAGDIADAEAAEILFHAHETKQRELNDTAIKRVLLVDDDDTLCELIILTIKDASNMELVCAYTVANARQRLEVGEKFDGIILDARVVNVDGVTFYREIMAKWPKMAVVFLTGFSDEKFRVEVESVGPAPVFQKKSAMRIDFLEKLFAQFGVRKK